MLTSKYVRPWLRFVLYTWRAMFIPWRVGFGGWLVAWVLGVLGGLPGALAGLLVAGLTGPRPPTALLMAGLLIGAMLGSAVGVVLYTLPLMVVTILLDRLPASPEGNEQPNDVQTD